MLQTHVNNDIYNKYCLIHYSAVQTPSEARVEQLIASALRDYAAKLQESSTKRSSSSSSETEGKAKTKKNSVRNLNILRKIIESIKHGLVKSKRSSQKTQRAIPAKHSREV